MGYGSKKEIQLSIRKVIIIVFALLMLITTVIIGFIIFSNWISSTEKTTTNIAQDLNSEIYNEINEFISSAMHVSDVNHSLIEESIIDIKNEKKRDQFFVSVLRSQSSEIYSFSFGTETGEYYGARRNENGIIEIMHNDSQTGGHSWYYALNDDMTAGELKETLGKFDPRTRDWYKAAKEARGPVFSPIYKHFVMNDLTVSAAYPIYNKDGSLFGVLGTHIILSNIDDYLKGIVKDVGGYAVILERESGKLVANSFDNENFKTLGDSTIQRSGIEDIGNKAIINAYNNYTGTGDDSLRISDEDGKLYVRITAYHINGLNWLILTSIPENLFMSDIYRSMLLTMLLVVAAVLFSVVVYFLLTYRLFKPVKALMDVTDNISAGDLTQRAQVVRNDEIGSISAGVNKMADKLVGLVTNLEDTVKDRTAHLLEANNALKENKEQLQLILDSTAEAIYGIDINGICTFCNASCLNMLGYSNSCELIGKNMHKQIHHSYQDGRPMPAAECKVLRALSDGEGTHVDDEVFWRADGTSFDVEYYSYPQYRADEVIGAVITFMDNTERKKAEKQIKYLGEHDSLTGLYNRMCFQNQIARLDCKENLPISIVFADVNGLKLTNDIFGHATGDKLIKKSSEILKHACRENDIAARVGGDEFVLLLPRTEKEEAERIIDRIKSELSEEKITAIHCSLSMGLSTKTQPYQNIEMVMENAENEMYKEKTLTRKSIDSQLISTIIDTLYENDPREKHHLEAVGKLCRKIGLAMGLSEKEVRRLEEAGFLHDIGKIALNKNIIRKQDNLTQEEKNEIQQHPIVGYRILNMFDDTLDLAEAVYSHHERWDGSGYPKSLNGKEIPLTARIIAVAESYDRIVNRLGASAPSKREAIKIILENAGTQFDPEIAKLFAELESNMEL